MPFVQGTAAAAWTGAAAVDGVTGTARAKVASTVKTDLFNMLGSPMQGLVERQYMRWYGSKNS
ncbi:hypothetical protein [Lentzea terrae]|uniref:hypothetical protein n=1 Tax=Lentzea terrae TaxID=2200761 RepID=UPI0018E56E1B|nr:hypothetical protein [Lentzea terrae]